MKIDLPTWQEIDGRTDCRIDMVEMFIYNYEPTAGAAEWRAALTRALEHVCPCEDLGKG